VGVDHRRADIAVTEQLLNGADIVTVLEHMRGEAVPQGVATRGLVNAGRMKCGLESALKNGFV
jgi:hypothetical protein